VRSPWFMLSSGKRSPSSIPVGRELNMIERRRTARGVGPQSRRQASLQRTGPRIESGHRPH
jgi:hypothetical protein